MRRFLDSIYAVSGGLAALFLILTCSVVLLQVVFNVVHVMVFEVTGLHVKAIVPSYAEFATYSFATSSFLGLGYTHREGGHIRVSLLIEKLGKRSGIWLDLLCTFVAALMAAYLAYHAFLQVGLSREFGDVSSGLVPIPLWIPQLAMAFGSSILCLALADDTVAQLRTIGLHLKDRWITPTLAAVERWPARVTEVAAPSAQDLPAHGPGLSADAP
jgi:TRAP-type C4-dicarboxylate transport system permease small subunit